MRAALAAFLAAFVIAAPWPADAYPADDGDTRPCVSRAEAKVILEDIAAEPTQRRLENLWEVTGLGLTYADWTTPTETGFWYPTCSARNDLAISYDRSTKRLTYMAWGYIPPGSPLVSASPYFGSRAR